MRFSKLAVSGVGVAMVVAGLLAASMAPPSTASADSAPTNPAQFYYVDATWANPVVVNGFLETYAYQQGYAASLGSPSTASVIVLDFGRQCNHAPGSQTTAWGVALTGVNNNCSSAYEPDLWVIERSEEFESGYSAGHSSASEGITWIGRSRGPPSITDS